MNEFEGAILLAQLDGVKERHARRNENAAYMNSKLKNFPGIVPQKLYEGTGLCSWWLYLTSFHREHFNNADRSKIIKALAAEGIHSGGYIATGFHRSLVVTDHILDLNGYKKMYSPDRLKKYREELICPNCDKVCEEVLSFGVPSAGSRDNLDDIFNAIMKVYANRDKLNSI